jgi:NTP pyrophosphatase (non-canonical NTP hydrolase)
MKIYEWQKAVHENAKEHGWHSGLLNIPEKLMLIVSEVSEALEAYRDDEMCEDTESNGKPVGFASELADIVIRTLDLAEAAGYDLESAISRKHEYNKTRPYRHGGKKC